MSKGRDRLITACCNAMRCSVRVICGMRHRGLSGPLDKRIGKDHSILSASAGSIEAALRAGIKRAIPAVMADAGIDASNGSISIPSFHEAATLQNRGQNSNRGNQLPAPTTSGS